LAIAGVREERDGGSEALLKSVTIIYPHGSRVIAVPGRPDTVRGYSANILLTEFAFFENPEATWRAIVPAVTNPLRGGVKKVRLITTPNGIGNKAHDIWSKNYNPQRWGETPSNPNSIDSAPVEQPPGHVPESESVPVINCQLSIPLPSPLSIIHYPLSIRAGPVISLTSTPPSKKACRSTSKNSKPLWTIPKAGHRNSNVSSSTFKPSCCPTN
jgi:hypothetical protein